MSLYLIVLLMCVGGGCLGYANTKLDVILYKVELLTLGTMLCFRYGQGTDYFGYAINYYRIPSSVDLGFLFRNNVHGELGYTFIVMIFRTLGASFEVFVFFWSLTMMLMTYYAITKYAGIKTLAVLLLYPTYYLTYYFSGMRQGFALAYMLCFAFPAWKENKKIKYAILVLLGTLVHRSVIVLLIPIFAEKFIRKHEKISLLLSCLCAIILCILLRTIKFDYRYVEYSPSIAAIILRIILYIMIATLYRFSKNKGKDGGNENESINDSLYTIYLAGFCTYICLCPMALISQRLTTYMKMVEVILISRLVEEIEWVIMRKAATKIKRYVTLMLTAICMVETVKNLESYTNQEIYTSQTHFYNYPYISVFDELDIYKYRDVDSIRAHIIEFVPESVQKILP